MLIKRWENHINIYATFVDKCMAVPYGMYDLILHLAVCVFLFWIEQFLFVFITLYLIVPEVINLTSVIKRYSPSLSTSSSLTFSKGKKQKCKNKKPH
jgi:hypothetical protein